MIRIERREEREKEISKNTQTNTNGKKTKQELQLLLVALSLVPHCSLGSRLNAGRVSVRDNMAV